MLYKVDFVRRNDRSAGAKWVNHAANHEEALTRFMDWFFRTHPDDAVRPERILEVSLIGDMSCVDLIDEAVGASATPQEEK